MREKAGGLRFLVKLIAALCVLYLIWNSMENCRQGMHMRRLRQSVAAMKEENFQDKKAEKEGLKRQASGTLGEMEQGPAVVSDGTDMVKEIFPAFLELKQAYPDLAGWLTIPDTSIDYPVMQSVDNNYYLEHDFTGVKDRNGSLFIKIQADVLKPDDNFIIYGHNMKNGSMFGSLKKYKEKSFFEDHPVLEFCNLYETVQYKILAVFEAVGYDSGEEFLYYEVSQIQTEAEFDTYYNNIKKLSLYDTGTEAEFGDRFLTLSTCDSGEEDGRFVVVAKYIGDQ